MVARLLAQLPQAIETWEAKDARMASLARNRPPQPRPDPNASAFATLVASLIHQQVSLPAGRSILRRVRSASGGRIVPKRLLALGPDRLRHAGVSPQKQRYLLDLARRVDAGELNLRTVGRRPDDEVVEALTQVTGIGPWTAKMFLMFFLQRPDVVAPEDLGLRLAVARNYEIPPSRTEAFLVRQSEAWKPYRTLACLTLWENKTEPS